MDKDPKIVRLEAIAARMQHVQSSHLIGAVVAMAMSSMEALAALKTVRVALICLTVVSCLLMARCTILDLHAQHYGATIHDQRG